MAIGETVARAVLEISADSSKYLSSISGMSQSLTSAFESPIGAIKSMATSVEGQLLGGLEALGPVGAGAAMGLAGVAAAGVAVGGALFALASSAAHAGDEVKDFHEKTGIAVANVGKWDFAAKAAGGSLGDLEGILKKLEINAAADQGGKFAAALKDVGINASDFKKMDAEQQLKAIAAGFQRGAASGNDMATATALMGKAGADSIPLLRNLTEDLLQQGEKLGVQWSDENVNAADNFKVAVSTVETALGNVGTKIGLAVLPAISDMLTAFASSPAFLDGLTAATTFLAQAMAVVVEVVGHLVQGVMTALAPAIAVTVGQVTFAVEMIKLMGSALLWAYDQVASFAGVQSVVGGIGSAFGWLRDVVTSVVSWIVTRLESIPIVGPKIKAAAETASSAFTGTMNAASAVGSMTDKLGSSLWNLGSASTGATAALDKQNKAHKTGAAEAEAHAKAEAALAQKVGDLADQFTGKKLAEQVDLTAAAYAKAGKEGGLTEAELKKLGKTLEGYVAQGAKLPPQLFEIYLAHQNLNDKVFPVTIESFQKLVKIVPDASGQLKKFIEPLGAIVSTDLSKILDFRKLTPEQMHVDSPGEHFVKAFKKNAGEFMQTEFPQTIMSAITGGGNIFEAAGSSLGGFLLGEKGFGKKITEGLTSILPAGLGSAISSMLPGIGALMGPLLGKITDLIGKAFSTAGRDAVVTFADSMGGFDALHKKLGELGAQGEQLWIRLTQGTPKNNPEAAKKVIAEIEAAFAAQGKAAADAAAAAEAAYKSAQDGIGNALGNVIKGTVDNQTEFDRLSRIALNTFNTLVKSGVEPVEAMKRVGGSVDVLIDSLEKSRLKGNAAFDQLKRWRELTKKNAPLLEQVGALNTLMETTETLGGMNAETFADMQAQGLDAYKELLAAGYTEAEARAQLKPLLEREIKLNKDKGYAIDDATQKIIAQGIANGDLADTSESMSDIMKEGITALILAIAGPEGLPKAWRTASESAKSAGSATTEKWRDPALASVSSVSDALNGLKDTYAGGFSIPIKLDLGDISMPSAVPMADGGFGRVTGPTLFLAGEAGAEDFAFSGGGRSFGSGAGGGAAAFDAQLRAELAGLRGDLRTVLPMLVESAARHGAQTAGRRR